MTVPRRQLAKCTSATVTWVLLLGGKKYHGIVLPDQRNQILYLLVIYYRSFGRGCCLILPTNRKLTKGGDWCESKSTSHVLFRYSYVRNASPGYETNLMRLQLTRTQIIWYTRTQCGVATDIAFLVAG
jgi:hypothetical protein